MLYKPMATVQVMAKYITCVDTLELCIHCIVLHVQCESACKIIITIYNYGFLGRTGSTMTVPPTHSIRLQSNVIKEEPVVTSFL